jgi:hypothetical protein
VSFASHDWRTKAADFLSGRKPAFATVLVGILLRAYGAEALSWDPLARRMQIEDDFGVELPRKEFEAIEALINAMTTDTAYRSVPVFHRTVQALNRQGLDDLDDMPDPDDLTWAVAELSANDPEPPLVPRTSIPYSDDIARYVGVVLDQHGVYGEPKVLRWADRTNPPLATNLGDDPLMFEAAMESSALKADELESELQNRFRALLTQLQELGIEPAPLKS